LRYAAHVANEMGPYALDPEARGILLSLWAAGASKSALECLDEKRRAVCSMAWQTLLVASEAERARVLVEWRAEAVSGLPRGVERLHPSWIACALEGEPAHILQIVLPDLPEPLRSSVPGLPGIAGIGSRPAETMAACPAAAKREIQRLAFAWLGPLCESDCGPLAESLCDLAFDELLSEVTRRGARALGQSLAGAAPALRARAMAAAGEPWAQVMGAAASESVSDADRKTAMAHAKMRIPDSARTPGERLLHIGLAALKSELAAEHPGSVARVAGRLPASLGWPIMGWSLKTREEFSWS
jgi:hypothetical protein